jgi:methylated-DNA-[protein]-cysteine S-methyltransferase
MNPERSPLLKYDIFESAYGWIGVVASEKGIKRITLPELTREDAEADLSRLKADAERDSSHFDDLRARLDRYFAGEPEDLTQIAIDLDDPEFFARARAACRSIPAGETRTYAWLAESAGSPNASQAAGQAMARNPVPLLVPCHRVVGSNGHLHGFGGGVGLPLKARLLELEGHLKTSEGRQLSLLA